MDADDWRALEVQLQQVKAVADDAQRRRSSKHFRALVNFYRRSVGHRPGVEGVDAKVLCARASLRMAYGGTLGCGLQAGTRFSVGDMRRIGTEAKYNRRPPLVQAPLIRWLAGNDCSSKGANGERVSGEAHEECRCAGSACCAAAMMAVHVAGKGGMLAHLAPRQRGLIARIAGTHVERPSFLKESALRFTCKQTYF